MRLALLMTVAACYSVPPTSRHATIAEHRIVSATIDAWLDVTGVALTEQCIAQRPRMLIARLDGSDLMTACATDIRVFGCYRLNDGLRGSLNRRRSTPVIVIRSDRDARATAHLIVHEATHWLAQCTGDVRRGAHGGPELQIKAIVYERLDL